MATIPTPETYTLTIPAIYNFAYHQETVAFKNKLNTAIDFATYTDFVLYFGRNEFTTVGSPILTLTQREKDIIVSSPTTLGELTFRYRPEKFRILTPDTYYIDLLFSKDSIPRLLAKGTAVVVGRAGG